ncbi:MAG: alpha/beta hydrolase [Actinobacteria bacterium]|nr:alpha/beta hydrolase [Actinomycetota bacterium]MCA1720817.1 alpha/beta hydrolase [Actinomycetota bacterium]
MSRTRLPAVLASLSLALVACGGSSGAPVAQDSPSPAEAAPSTPAASPATSTPPAVVTPTPTAVVPKALAWKGCKDGFECSTLSVPLDYAKPADGNVSLRLVRIKATNPSRRIGAMLVNPGGPGVSAVDFLRGFAKGSTPEVLRRQFDLVAFDPRGTTGSAPVHCLGTAQLDRFFKVDQDPDDPAEVRALDDQSKVLAQGCQQRSGRILAHLSTADAARDMDSVRAALGEAKLTYLGYSYGTALGAAYLDQFPTHVRAMVLDGALDPTLTWDQVVIGQAKGFDGALGSFLAWCNAHADKCEFRGAVEGDLGAAYDRIRARLEKSPAPGIGKRTVGPAELYFGAGQSLYSTSYWESLGTGLAELEGGQGSVMLQLSDLYLDRGENGYTNTIEANYAVNCVDRPFPKDNAAYQQLADKLATDAPRFGPGVAWGSQACARWPVPPTGTPHAVSGKGSPPIVVIGTTRDPATPYVWAQALAKQLDKGVLITFNGDGHTAFRRGAPACVVDPVNIYLLTGKAPADTRC